MYYANHNTKQIFYVNALNIHDGDKAFQKLTGLDPEKCTFIGRISFCLLPLKETIPYCNYEFVGEINV